MRQGRPIGRPVSEERLPPGGRLIASAALHPGLSQKAARSRNRRDRGWYDAFDLAWEVKLRWPLMPVILTSGLPREPVGELPPGVSYMPEPWQPLNVLIAAEQALASARVGRTINQERAFCGPPSS
jgi:hypothetical protein